MAGCQVMEKLSDYLDSEIASIMANIVPCTANTGTWKNVGHGTGVRQIMKNRMEITEQFMICKVLCAFICIQSPLFQVVVLLTK